MFSWPPSRFGGRRAGESPRDVDKMIWKRRARELVTERLGMPLSAGAGAEVYEDPLVPTMRAVKLKDRRTFLVPADSLSCPGHRRIGGCRRGPS